MQKIIDFFIKRPVWANSFIAIIVLFGLFSVFTMKRSFFPELDPQTIVASVFYSGASPKEMEEGVTIKVEQAVKGLEGIDEINSVSSENFAQITIKAYQDTDMDELLSDVENAVNSINSFPQGAEKPTIRRMKTSGMSSNVAFIGINSKSDSVNAVELADLATKVERELLNTKEITQITKNGFPEKEISISVREQDLQRYNISIQEIALAVGSKNVDLTTGIIRGNVEEMNVRSNQRTTNVEDLGKIVVRTGTEGDEVKIRDVADVKIGYSENSQQALFNGKPAITFQIDKTAEQDIKKVTDAIYAYKEKFNETNPDFELNIYFESNGMLNQRIDLLTSNGLMGLILVLLFLGLFLNIKLSAWVAFGIPFSFLGMFIAGMFYGITINMISLFGMIVVVGILVDDGIVISENIYTHFEKGKTARQAAIDGTMEVLPSVFSSVITTIVAFSVLFFVEGLEMMREMAFVVISCLSFSLFEAFLVLPGHLGHKKVLSEERTFSFSYLKGIIYMVIGLLVIFTGTRLFPSTDVSFWKILFPFTVIILGVVLFFNGFAKSPMEHNVRSGADKAIKYVRDKWHMEAVKIIIGTRLKWYRLTFFFPFFFLVAIIVLTATKVISFTFFPPIQPDFFTIEAAYKPGDSKTKTDAYLMNATQIMLEENQRIIDENGDSLLTYYISNRGFSLNIGQAGNHTGMIQVFFDGENSKTPVDTLKNRIVRRLALLDEAKLAQTTYVGGFQRFGKPIEFGLSSTNESNLLKARELMREEMTSIPGIINIKDNMPPGKTEVNLKLRPQAEVYGLTQNEVLAQIRGGFFGQEAQRVIIGTDEVKIWVRYTLEDRNTLYDLERMKIKTRTGMSVPLNEICTFEIGRAPESLKRRDGQRMIKIDAECVDPDKVAESNQRIWDELIPKMNKIYPDIKSMKLGQAERSQKTGNSMMIAFLIAVIIMFIILTLHFNSLSNAFLIMLVVPAGFAGAILGHGLVGIPVSLLSIFGMIALLGVLVNDAIVFLDRYNDLIVEGYDVKPAVLEAVVSRFRPILLTTLTTVAGLMPIIQEKSMQAQFLIPVAVSLAFGVLFGTIFILFFYPSAVLFWNGCRKFFRRIGTGEKVLDSRSVEPVLKLKGNEHE